MRFAWTQTGKWTAEGSAVHSCLSYFTAVSNEGQGISQSSVTTSLLKVWRSGDKGCTVTFISVLFACAGATAGVAFCRPVPWEALGGNHRSVHSILQRPPPDFKLHKSRHGRQGEWIKINWNNKWSIIHNNINKQDNNNSQVLAMLVILAWHYRTTALSTIISQTWSSCTSCVLFATNVTKYQNEADFSRVKHFNFVRR